MNVQEEFEKFLRERGIAESLALFIPEFAEYKEQKVRVELLTLPLSADGGAGIRQVAGECQNVH